MKSKTLLIFSSLIILFSSCSKEAAKTNAKVNLKLGGITNFTSGIGSGGVILFGKSATSGEQFGRVLVSEQESLDLSNGDWSFYAIMWDSTNGAKLNGTSYCGKTTQRLTGVAVNIGMTLNNANCSDPVFSNGDIYTDGLSKNRFADFSLEECDELNKSGPFYCHGENQGSAVSYRMVFQSYTRKGMGPPMFSSNVIYSQCMKAKGIPSMISGSMNFNFPSSKIGMPFVASVEMFLGSPDCSEITPENKGKYIHTFSQGIASESSAINKFVRSSPNTCNTTPTTKNQCEDYLGFWNGTSCLFSGPSAIAFIPGALCSSSINVTSKHIKQMLEIPKPILCSNPRFFTRGSDVFPGGNGDVLRPYKICNEWQLNQIGEIHATVEDFSQSSFKLMNDLDMNVTDFNALLRPECAGMGQKLGNHHNLNPLSKITTGDCTTLNSVPGLEYEGVFNGNGKTIKNGRIFAKDVGYVGFVGILANGGVIKNLTFKNLEVRGHNTVGGVAGMMGPNTIISNVKIFGGDVESSMGVGGITSGSGLNSLVSDVEVRDMRIHGKSEVGGLIGSHSGVLEKSMFRGDIKQHENMDANIGGLVGINQPGAEIRNSFSEGTIETSLRKVGGIVGHNNSGGVHNVYSNMYIRSMFQGANAAIGGIIGVNAGADVLNTYSDSVLQYKGSGGGYSVDGISAMGDGFSNSTCASSSNTPHSSCYRATLRDGATSLAGSSEWVANINNALPRLSWEYEKGMRSCLLDQNLQSLAVQSSVGMGRGSILNPIIICTASQLKELENATSNQYFMLAEDINISGWTTESQTIQNFVGHLNGADFAIYGLNNFYASTATVVGIIKNNVGTISNLNIIGNKISHTNTGATGILAGTNSGQIKNVNFIGNEVLGKTYVGTVTGSNTGAIDDVVVSRGQVSGETYVGGIAGQNINSSGRIIRASSNVEMVAGFSAYEYFGGIVGYNGASATLDQTVFSGPIHFTTASTVGNLINVGGIAGANDGLIKNSMTKNYASIRVLNNELVGGLVGLNDTSGVIQTSFSLAKVIYSNSGNPVPGASRFDGIIGENQGYTDTSVFYLSNNVGALIETSTSPTCSGSSIDFTSAGPVPTSLTVSTTSVNLIAPVNIGNSDDALKTYYPFTVPTTANVVDIGAATLTCSAGTMFEIVKNYDRYVGDKRSIASFSNLATFSGYDIAYDSNGAGTDVRLDALLEYHKAQMDNRTPIIPAPVWSLEAGDSYPRLLQVND